MVLQVVFSDNHVDLSDVMSTFQIIMSKSQIMTSTSQWIFSQKFLRFIVRFGVTILLSEFVSQFHKRIRKTEKNLKLNPTIFVYGARKISLTRKSFLDNILSFHLLMRIAYFRVYVYRLSTNEQCRVPKESQIGVVRKLRLLHKLCRKILEQ